MSGRKDSESDPALDDSEGGEWADEGGAVEEGPATDPQDEPPADGGTEGGTS